MLQIERLSETIVLEVSNDVDLVTCRVLQDAIAVARTTEANLVLAFDTSANVDRATLGVLFETASALGDRLWIVASMESRASRSIRNALSEQRLQIVAHLAEVEPPRQRRNLDGDDAPTAERSVMSSGWNLNKLVGARRL